MISDVVTAPPRLLVAILCGGESRRFGSDKAQAHYQGRPIIAHVIEAARIMSDAVVLCGRAHADLLSLPDRPTAGLGPLGGLNAALHHARRVGLSHVLTLGCDMPVIPPDLLTQLTHKGSAYVDDQPIVGLWEARLATWLDAHLAEAGARSMRHWTARCGAKAIGLRQPLPNINTPAELAALETAAMLKAGHVKSA